MKNFDDVREAEQDVGRRIVELGRVEQAAVHRRHDFAARKDGDRRAHLLEQVGRQTDGAVLHALEVVAAS